MPGVHAGVRHHSPPADTFETAVSKNRVLSTKAQSTSVAAMTVESSDPALSAALLAARIFDTAESHGAVAAEYARLGIMDKAHEHLTLATKLNPEDAAAWDGLARIWRDWGVPHLGLPDAYRAVYFAPGSPVVHNTLGTILDALGQHADARAQYQAVLQLDPDAAYALNNTCYSWMLQGQARRAIEACTRALAVRPEFDPARNNLGLAYAQAGDLPAAERAFASSTKSGRAQYNMGLVHMACRNYRDAVKAFQEAQTLRPGFAAAQVMARAAQKKASEGNEP
jgi:tetratricopeptide (TPR) repeat protein